MTYGDLINNVARTVGDYLPSMAASPWKDGAQFTKEMKADYCIRAMQSIMQSALMQVRALPYPIASSIMEKMFPGMIRELSGASPIEVTASYVLGATGVVSGTTVVIPLSPVSSYTNVVRGRQWLNGQSADVMGYVRGKVGSTDKLEVVIDGTATGVKIYYIERPPEVITSSMMTTPVAFDSLWTNEIIKRASVYAYIDNQSTDTLQALQMNDSFYQSIGQ